MVCKGGAAPAVGFRWPAEHRAAVQRVIGDPPSERVRAGQGRDGAGPGAVCAGVAHVHTHPRFGIRHWCGVWVAHVHTQGLGAGATNFRES
jgi:hypothetical protein